MKLITQVFIVAFIATAVSAACTKREKDDDSSDLYEDIKCGLSTAGEKIKDGVSTVGSSLKDGTHKALDVISKAASKTGSVLRDGYNAAVESSKSGYELLKDAVTGRKPAEYRDGDGIIGVRIFNATEP